MIRIKPYTTTDGDLVAVQLDVKEANISDVSVDAIWTLYDKDGNHVNDGRLQLADGDFVAYRQTTGYLEKYVMEVKGLEYED